MDVGSERYQLFSHKTFWILPGTFKDKAQTSLWLMLDSLSDIYFQQWCYSLSSSAGSDVAVWLWVCGVMYLSDYLLSSEIPPESRTCIRALLNCTLQNLLTRPKTPPNLKKSYIMAHLQKIRNHIIPSVKVKKYNSASLPQVPGEFFLIRFTYAVKKLGTRCGNSVCAPSWSIFPLLLLPAN